MAANQASLWLSCIAVLLRIACAQASPSWVVEVRGKEILGVTKNAIVSSLQRRDEAFQITDEYSTDVFAGLSVTCRSGCDQSIRAIQGVKHVWKPNTYHQRSMERQPGPVFRSNPRQSNSYGQGTGTGAHVNDAHFLTQVDLLHSRNLTGKGVRVAIVDGGLDYLHPALGAGFGPGYRVEYGWDFVGDNVKPPNKEKPDDDPYGDCSNHATHTAGILFGQDTSGGTNFTGVAPGVRVEHYRVFDCNGMSASDVVLRAVLLAYERGVDLINLSLGSGSRPFSDDPLASLLSRINREGKTFVLIAGGNSGRNGAFSAAAPEGGGNDVFAVGSVDTTYSYSVSRPATLVSDGRPVGNLTYNAETWTAHRRSEFPSRVEVVALNADGCAPIKNENRRYNDRIVLMKRGGCALKSKMENLVRAGGEYALIYNNVDGPAFDLEVRLDSGLEIRGAASATQGTGEAIVKLLTAGHKVELEMDSNFTRPPVIGSIPNAQTASKVSTFTSWGPSGEGKLISRVLAPGGGVLSTFPRRNGGWGLQSGTSMAVPYVVGVFALLKEAFPTVPTNVIASAVAVTARPLSFNDGTNKSFGFLASPWQQGSGLLDAWGAFVALTSGASADVTRLEFNDTEFGGSSLTFDLRNTGSERLVYAVFSAPSVSVLALDKTTRAPVRLTAAIKTPEAASEFLETLSADSHADTTLSATNVVLAPGEQAAITLSVDTAGLASAEGRCPLYGGFITLASTSRHGQYNLSIPYAGIACRVKDIPTLSTSETSLASATRDEVATAKFWNKPLRVIEDHHVFRLSRDEPPFDDQKPDVRRFMSERLPVVQVQLNMHTRGIRAELIPATGEAAVSMFSNEVETRTGGWGRVERVYWVWDGRLPNGSFAAAGRYSVRVRTLRLFGNEAREEDWKDEVSTSSFKVGYENGAGEAVHYTGPENQPGLMSLIPCY